MKKIITILTITLFSLHCSGQDKTNMNIEGFKSVFQNLKSGFFTGTTNGILIIENTERQKTILDFQGSEGHLQITEDSNEVYDVSTKRYLGKTTSGFTEIMYETYAYANGIGIKLNGIWFELSAIDGSCEGVINGLDYIYESDKETEYLIIRINRELELSNCQYLISKEYKKGPVNIYDLQQKAKTIKLLPNSTLVFAIKIK